MGAFCSQDVPSEVPQAEIRDLYSSPPWLLSHWIWATAGEEAPFWSELTAGLDAAEFSAAKEERFIPEGFLGSTPGVHHIRIVPSTVSPLWMSVEWLNLFRGWRQTYEGQKKLSPLRCDLGTARSDRFTQGKIKLHHTCLASLWNFSAFPDLRHNLWYCADGH